MKLKECKTTYKRIMLFATNPNERTYKKVLGVGYKEEFSKYADIQVLSISDNHTLQTTTIIIEDNNDLKGNIIRGSGW